MDLRVIFFVNFFAIFFVVLFRCCERPHHVAASFDELIECDSGCVSFNLGENRVVLKQIPI